VILTGESAGGYPHLRVVAEYRAVMEPFGTPPGPRSTPLPGSASAPPAAGPHGFPPQQPGFPPQQPGFPPQQPYAQQPYQQPGFAPQPYAQPGFPATGYAQPMFAVPGRRQRRKVTLTLGLLMMLAGVVVGILGIIRIVDQVQIPDDEKVAFGVVGQTGTSFERTALDPERYTVYIEGARSSSSGSRSDAASVTCSIESADGTDTIFGSSQTTSVNINGTASVGTFSVPEGPVTVLCDASRPFPFFVAEGGPRLSLGTFALPFIGVALFVIGLILTIVGAVGKRVPNPM